METRNNRYYFLLGKSLDEAKGLFENSNFTVEYIATSEDSPCLVTADYREDRWRVFYNPETGIVEDVIDG